MEAPNLLPGPDIEGSGITTRTFAAKLLSGRRDDCEVLVNRGGRRDCVKSVRILICDLIAQIHHPVLTESRYGQAGLCVERIKPVCGSVEDSGSQRAVSWPIGNTPIPSWPGETLGDKPP